jgi:hypothetical protein
MTHETECREKIPRNREFCNNIRPCGIYTAQISLPGTTTQTARRKQQRQSMRKKTWSRIHDSAEDRMLRWPERIPKRCNDSPEKPREGKIVNGSIPLQTFQKIEIPVQETTKKRALSEYAGEEGLGDMTAETVDKKVSATKAMKYKSR